MAAVTHREELRRPSLRLVDLGSVPASAESPPPRRVHPAAVAILVAVLLASAVVVRGDPTPTSATPGAGAAGAHRYVVRPGDTYWSIATSLGAPGDVRAVVDRLVGDNRGRTLQPGDTLVVPVP